MGDNAALTAAKRAKKDEFYTQRVDIENGSAAERVLQVLRRELREAGAEAADCDLLQEPGRRPLLAGRLRAGNLSGV